MKASVILYRTPKFFLSKWDIRYFKHSSSRINVDFPGVFEIADMNCIQYRHSPFPIFTKGKTSQCEFPLAPYFLNLRTKYVA